jgi:hypothetical protein
MKHAWNRRYIGSLPNNRVKPGNCVSASIASSLFGHKIQGSVNKRQTGKDSEVIFICMSSSAINVELNSSYFMDSFLMVFRSSCASG